MQVQPYLFFNGRCEEAVEFYRGALGAEVEMLMRYKDSPDPPPPSMTPPGSEDKVMHVNFLIGRRGRAAANSVRFKPIVKCSFQSPLP